MASSQALRVGFVPEHFSTPLYFAKKHFGLNAELIPFPSGTGHMIISLRSEEIDVGIGLTEGWVAGLGKDEMDSDGGYRIVGTYVETPLCWAISTGPKRSINHISDLKNRKCGVSRVGSGSYVMSFVLADQQGWLSSSSSSSAGDSGEDPFRFIPLQTFDKLRQGVNDETADFFMWEHFTSKRYYDNGDIKKIGEIYTPWSSWKIVASTSLTQSQGQGQGQKVDQRLDDLFKTIDQGVKYFTENHEEAISYISTQLDYSDADAREWLKTVKFASSTKGVDIKVVEQTVETLRKAGVLGKKGMQPLDMIGRQMGAQLP